MPVSGGREVKLVVDERALDGEAAAVPASRGGCLRLLFLVNALLA